MASQSQEPLHLLLLSLAAKCNLSSLSLPALLFALSLLLLSSLLFTWASPGGPAWGHFYLASPLRRPIIPGPRGVPLLGSLPLMGGLAHRRLAALLSPSLRPLMALSLATTRLVVTSDPVVARDILSSPHFADRPIKESAKGLLFHRAMGFAPYGAYWRTLRRISSSHLFCPKQIQVSGRRREEIAGEMVRALRVAGEGGFPVIVRPVLKGGALDSVMGTVFGRSYGVGPAGGVAGGVAGEGREVREMVEEGYELLGVVNWGDHLPGVGVFDFWGVRARCGHLVPRVDRFVRGIIKEHRARSGGEVGRESDFVDVLLSLQESEKLEDADVVAVLWEMIFRGTDTVAVLIEWVLARLVMHQDVQARVHDELDKVVGSGEEVTESNVGSLLFLQAVIKETLRMHPPGPLLSWARLATSDVEVAGYVVPAGTTAMVNMWAITHDPLVWDKPMEFIPDRFMVGSGAIDFEFSVFGSDLRLAPFGAGRRSCPGKALAMTTVVFWVAKLMHEFEMRLPSNKTHVDLSEVLKLSCEMATPLAIQLSNRRSKIVQ